jgi:acetyl-CoA synthetase
MTTASLLPADVAVAPPRAPRPVEVTDLETYRRLYARSLADPEGFWRERIAEFRWGRVPHRVVSGEGAGARWFDGGRVNVTENALDRWVGEGRGDWPALVWESEAVDEDRRPREVRRLTYRELRDEVARVAGALRDLGVGAGDRVTVYLPIVPELPITMLACARLGAVHNVIFAGFPEQALLDRIEDSGSRVVVTADGGWRHGATVPLKAVVDAAARRTERVERVLVLRRTGTPVDWIPERDRWWHDAVPGAAPASPVPVESAAPLFLMYTSGSTGRPKGIAHATAGYLVHTALTARHAFDLRAGDVSWCTADPAWITGHTYTVYGPLLCGATTVLYEGVLAHPDWGRAWDVVERHRPSVLYSTPTLVRAWRRHGDGGARARDLGSLRLLASVGEPINPSVWTWYREVVGGGRTPVVDTWWQTEAGAAMIFPFPYATPAKPGSATLPFFGVEPGIADDSGRLLEGEASGQLVIRRPWPGMLQGIWGDPRRSREAYWTKVPGAFVTGDAARRDAEGYYWIAGRTDDVIKVNGHRLGTAEIEGAVMAHAAVAECAVVGLPDESVGEAVLAFAVLKPGHGAGPEVERDIVRAVERLVGKLARPREVRVLPALPKNRSGKILRRLLREWAITGRVSGDVTTLEDATALPPPRAGG